MAGPDRRRALRRRRSRRRHAAQSGRARRRDAARGDSPGRARARRPLRARRRGLAPRPPRRAGPARCPPRRDAGARRLRLGLPLRGEGGAHPGDRRLRRAPPPLLRRLDPREGEPASRDGRLVHLPPAALPRALGAAAPGERRARGTGDQGDALPRGLRRGGGGLPPGAAAPGGRRGGTAPRRGICGGPPGEPLQRLLLLERAAPRLPRGPRALARRLGAARAAARPAARRCARARARPRRARQVHGAPPASGRGPRRQVAQARPRSRRARARRPGRGRAPCRGRAHRRLVLRAQLAPPRRSPDRELVPPGRRAALVAAAGIPHARLLCELRRGPDPPLPRGLPLLLGLALLDLLGRWFHRGPDRPRAPPRVLELRAHVGGLPRRAPGDAVPPRRRAPRRAGRRRRPRPGASRRPRLPAPRGLERGARLPLPDPPPALLRAGQGRLPAADRARPGRLVRPRRARPRRRPREARAHPGARRPRRLVDPPRGHALPRLRGVAAHPRAVGHATTGDGGEGGEVPLNEGLRRLIDLQKLDDELATLEEEHRALPGRRDALAAQQSAAEERLAAGREALRAAELVQRHAERDLQDREGIVSRLEGQQHQVKTNEAYTALLREIDHAREAISACETRILEAMEGIEACGAAVAAAEAEAKAAGERAQAGTRTLAARESELGARIAALRERRAEARGKVERDLIELYERIAARKRPAVVTVTREICTGCRVDIPPQRFVEILSHQRVVTCGRCQRILIHAEA